MNQCSYIYENLDDNKLLFAMYLDFKKAFDSVDQDILLKKLHFYGVRGSTSRWFRSYMTDRTKYVSVNGTKSDARFIPHSVPQGSNLGPLLFLIYINDQIVPNIFEIPCLPMTVFYHVLLIVTILNLHILL